MKKRTHFGLMQINAINLDWLRDMGIDPMTPAGNIEAGVYIIARHFQAYGDPELALMAYNNGPTGAGKLWDKGIYQTGYSQKVMGHMRSGQAYSRHDLTVFLNIKLKKKTEQLLTDFIRLIS